MEKLKFDLEIYCMNSEEYFDADKFKQNIEKCDHAVGVGSYFIYIEDRGILLHRASSPSTEFNTYYVLQSKYNLKSGDLSSVYFKPVKYIGENGKPTYVKTNLSKFAESYKTKAIVPEDVMQHLINRFLKYSNYLYVDPFNPDSKKIIYVNPYTNCIYGEECKDYLKISEAVKSSMYYLASIAYKSGVFYMLGEQLICAKPYIHNYLGSTYCINRYFKCFPSENGEIQYESISIDELPVIVDTFSLLKYDNALDEESRVASLKGDYLFIDNMRPETVEYNYLDTACEVPDSETFMVDVTKDCNHFNYYIGSFNKDTTDFTLVVFLNKDAYSGKGKYGTRSSVYRSDIFNPIHLWRALRYLSINEAFFLDIIAFTPFNSEDYSIFVLDDIPVKRIVPMLQRKSKDDRYPILYDKSNDCFYFMDFIDCIEGVVFKVDYSSGNPPVFKVLYQYIDSEGFIKDDNINWRFFLGSGDIYFMLSYSLMEYIRNRYKEDVNSF